MRVPVVGTPLADIHVMGARPVFGQRLFSVARQDFDVDAGAFRGLLEVFGDALHRLRGAHVDGDLESIGQAGFLEQVFGLVDVEFVGLFGARAEQADRQEVLVDDTDVLDQRVADGVVVNQPLECFAHFGFGQVGVLLVQADVVHRAFGRTGGLDLLVLGKRGEVFRRQVARNIGVALFQHQALGRGFLDVAVDDTRQPGLRSPVIVVTLQCHDFIGTPLAQLHWPGTGITGLQPRVAPVTGFFVGHHEFFVDDRGDVGRQAVVDKGRCIFLVGLNHHRQGANRPDLVFRVVLGESELGQDEGRRLVQDHGALQRIHHVFGGQGVA